MKEIKMIEREKGTEIENTGVFRGERRERMERAPLKGYSTLRVE
ncbi:hypothetical protein [Methanofervidicoccus sp. A16]|nr:hypothetical protein [Methanofervidicoccus sp. A16]